MFCSRCHACGNPIQLVLNYAEYCTHCRQYQRPLSHGYDNPSPTETEGAPCTTDSSIDEAQDSHTNPFTEADIIHSYTRADAIADGSLIDISADIRAECGIRFPIALTRAVWNEYVRVPEELTNLQDEPGRLADILVMFHHAAKHAPQGVERIIFHVIMQQQPQQPLPPPITLQAVIDGGDDGKGAITVLLPDADYRNLQYAQVDSIIHRPQPFWPRRFHRQPGRRRQLWM